MAWICSPNGGRRVNLELCDDIAVKKLRRGEWYEGEQLRRNRTVITFYMSSEREIEWVCTDEIWEEVKVSLDILTRL